jgi:hypothetical protein
MRRHGARSLLLDVLVLQRMSVARLSSLRVKTHPLLVARLFGWMAPSSLKLPGRMNGDKMISRPRPGVFKSEMA